MRSALTALAVYLGSFLGLAGPSIDVDQVKSDAACELVYCSLATAPSVPSPPPPAPDRPSREIPRLDPPPPIPAAAAAAAEKCVAAEPKAAARPGDRPPPKPAARSAPPIIYYAPANCSGGNCRPRRFSRR